MARSSTLSLRLCVMLAVFLGVFGQKLNLIEQYGSDLPFWDAWDAEGDALFKPALRGELPASIWIKPHNEHRILFTRVLSLGLLDLNDHQWDARLELVVNAGLHSLAIALLAGCALAVLPFWGVALFAALAIYLAGSPVSNENTLAGFQSQFYFLLLIPGLHLWASLASRPRSLLWWLAPLLGVAALFTMASGFFSALAVVGVSAILFLRDRKVTTDQLWLAIPNTVIAAAGWLLKVDIAEHASLRAANPSAWLDAWLHQLSWPVMDLWFAPIGAAPFLLFLIATFKGKLPGARYQVLLGAGIWSWLQYAAIAYARGGTSHGYASRYTDILAVVVLVNLLMLAAVSLQACRPRTCWGIAAAAVLYLLAVVWGYHGAVIAAEKDPLPVLQEVNRNRIKTVRDFVTTGNFSFYGKDPWNELPYPSAQRLGSLLKDPTIRSILPSSVRPALPLAIDQAASKGFSEYQGAPGSVPVPMDLTAVTAGGATAEPAELFSQPFTTDHGIVSVFVSGTVTASLLKVSLYDHGGQPIEPLDSAAPVAGRWKRVNFHAPAGTYQLAVQREGPGTFAITQPFTDTALSRFAEKTTHQGGPLLWLAGIAALAALLLGFVRQSEPA